MMHLRRLNVRLDERTEAVIDMATKLTADAEPTGAEEEVQVADDYERRLRTAARLMER